MKKRISDICQVINGRAYKQNELLQQGKYRVLRVGNFFTSDKWYYSDFELAEDKYCDKGDLLFAWSATFGPKIWDGEKVIYHYHIWKMIPDVSVVDKWYLYYWLKKNVSNITAGVHGSVMAHITKSEMENFEIDIPPLRIQQVVASILRAIDDKIRNNKAINDNLEFQFKHLYQHYFVDSRQSSWGMVPLSTLFSFQEGPGIRNWQYVPKNGTKFINIRCINNGDIHTETANMISNEEAKGKYAHFMLNPYDIVMSCSGTLGRYAIVQERHLPLCLNTSVIRFAPNIKTDFTYLYGYLTSKEFLRRQEEMAAGSVQQNFGPTHLKRMEICNAPPALREKFYELSMPVISKILSLRDENAKLAQLRDVLLPRLMSGEVDVSNINL